ncbi:putative methionyl-tRNA synthetase [Hordeum vulgare]|nr:putative methionyl-tRNA synthetase [Hordeum vulgare]
MSQPPRHGSPGRRLRAGPSRPRAGPSRPGRRRFSPARPRPRPARPGHRGRRGGGDPRRGQAAAGGPRTASSRPGRCRPRPGHRGNPGHRPAREEEPTEGLLAWAARGFLEGRRRFPEAEEGHGAEEARAPDRLRRRTSSCRHEVFEEMANPTSFMDLLQDAEVDLGAPPLEPFGEEVGEDEEDVGDDEEEVAEIGEEAFTAASRPHARSSNYTEAEDILLVRAWASVGMDATTGTDQTGKRYWHRIEDNYCRIKPKNCGFLSRSYRSLQGRWDLMKPTCARWSVAMDQVRDAPPSGTVESDYETIAGMRYKEMAASKGKPFPFKHAWAILQTFDKWKLRDQETAPKKSAMLRMDGSEDEEKERNLGKPEGTKKGKQRVKMEGEASRLREKMEKMMKAIEELTRKTLETKILITEKKKEVKLAQVEAKREEAKRKADLEERMIKVKEAKVWKELMVEEKEHMMMSKKDMDEEQLQWWKDYKEDIAERKRIFRGASSTFRGGGDGGVDDSNGGA